MDDKRLESPGLDEVDASSRLKEQEVIEKQKVTGQRKGWVYFVWMITFFMPTFMIRWIVRTKRKDIQQAWREKFAINLLIWFGCAAVMFLMGMILS